MSFTAEEVLEEFDDAARLGQRTQAEMLEWWWDLQWSRRQKRGYAIAPVRIESARCPTCGAPIEFREGLPKSTHMGPPMPGCPQIRRVA